MLEGGLPDARATARYQVLRRIGEGGMGVVYEAEDKERGQRVALKTIASLDVEKVYQLKREFRVLGRVRYGYGSGYWDEWFLSLDDGTVSLVDATPKGFELHGQFEISPKSENRNPKGKIWTHPVVSGGKLFLRDQELLFCFDVSGK